ncbi:MAG: 50S ribosomal protein L11 methyltransferase [Burkholderiaceae bacterium]|nr:50S ribosomal protein L11 methyltransferase [Burkholderiaceae bacterium]
MYELVLHVPEEGVELVSDALESLDALSVSVEDADALTPQEHAMFGEPGLPAPKAGWQRSTVTALFAEQAQADDAARLLQAQDFFDGCTLVGIRPVADQDWVRLTQSQFDPVEITPSFWIVPTWHEPPAAAAQCLRLDPGLAFGTGTHPTTRMCLRWIAAHPPTAQRVLDYGCGSGILAMAARLFGAGETDAVDIDPSAVSSTQVNAVANHVQLNAGLPDLAQGTYQLVLANILATPLKVLAPLLCARLAPGASLVLAGILSRQAEELQQAYAPWVQLVVADEQEGWILMTATAPTP